MGATGRLAVSAGGAMGSSTHCRCVIAQAATHIYLRNLLRATPDVSAIGDAAIRASKEFQSYMDRNNRWQWQDRVTEAEALHACRLMLRDVSVRQARRANAIADRYRDSIDWGQREVRVVVNGKVRVLDIADPAGYRAVEVKEWICQPQPPGRPATATGCRTDHPQEMDHHMVCKRSLQRPAEIEPAQGGDQNYRDQPTNSIEESR